MGAVAEYFCNPHVLAYRWEKGNGILDAVQHGALAASFMVEKMITTKISSEIKEKIFLRYVGQEIIEGFMQIWEHIGGKRQKQ